MHSEYSSLYGLENTQHAKRSLVLASISAAGIIRHVAVGVILKRGLRVAHQSSRACGVQCCSSVGLTALFVATSKVNPQPGGNASHALICQYRGTAARPVESEQPGGQQGRLCERRECVSDRGRMECKQWGRENIWQPRISQVVPLKKRRELCDVRHRCTSAVRDRIEKRRIPIILLQKIRI